MLGELGGIEVVEAGAAQGLGREGEAGRMDDVDMDAKAGAQPQHGAGVLGNVGLEQSEVDGDFGLPPGSGRWLWLL